MKIEELEKGQKILVECEFDSLAGANQAWVSIQGDPGLAQLDDIKLIQPKLEVPQCVFDLIKKYKNENRSFYAFIENTSDVKEVWEWLNMPKPGIKESELMQAWLAYPNITVEKEIRKDFDWAWQQKFQKEVANEL